MCSDLCCNQRPREPGFDRILFLSIILYFLMIPFTLLFLLQLLFYEVMRILIWLVTCFHFCKSTDMICKFRNVKSETILLNLRNLNGWEMPINPPYPKRDDVIMRLRQNPLSFYNAMRNIEEDVNCCAAIAICFYGRQTC